MTARPKKPKPAKTRARRLRRKKERACLWCRDGDAEGKIPHHDCPNGRGRQRPLPPWKMIIKRTRAAQAAIDARIASIADDPDDYADVPSVVRLRPARRVKTAPADSAWQPEASPAP